jgi:hypothetical protein
MISNINKISCMSRTVIDLQITEVSKQEDAILQHSRQLYLRFGSLRRLQGLHCTLTGVEWVKFSRLFLYCFSTGILILKRTSYLILVAVNIVFVFWVMVLFSLSYYILSFHLPCFVSESPVVCTLVSCLNPILIISSCDPSCLPCSNFSFIHYSKIRLFLSC